jgi:DNA-binding XRE family transcriptional regulator
MSYELGHNNRREGLSSRWVMEAKNNVRKIREAKMLSRAELARLAGISPLTLDRIERGLSCRVATKRKIVLALGLKITQKNRVFAQ